jgi:hypothetical protein
MYYNATFTGADISPVLMDFGGELIVAIGYFAVLIAIILIYNFLKKSLNKHK